MPASGPTVTRVSDRRSGSMAATCSSAPIEKFKMFQWQVEVDELCYVNGRQKRVRFCTSASCALTTNPTVSSRSVAYRCAKIQIAPSVRDRIPSSASYAPAQFRMEFSSNRSDDVCGIILGVATDKKHLISQRQARRDVLGKYRAGSGPCER
jgi:hypothetical protein